MDIKYICEEHLDEAMDDFINESETFPIINKVEGKKCCLCENQCKYELK